MEVLELSVVYLFCILDNPSMMVHSSNPFVCRWNVTNRIVNDLNGTGHRNRKNCVCGNGGCLFGCFGMARDPLNEDGRQYGVDGTVDRKCSRMG